MLRPSRRTLFLWLVVIDCSVVRAGAESFAGFNDFVEKYELAPANARANLTKSFIDWQQKNGGFPIIENDRQHVVFLCLAGSGKDTVRLAGDFLPASFHDVYWARTGVEMRPIADGAAVFFKRLRFETDARFDYEFIVNEEPKADPLNPRTLFSGIAGREVSELAMPDFEHPREILPRANVSSGTVLPVAEEWANPTVRIYLPAAYDASVSYPVVYTADGTAWNEYIGLPTILDNLIADRLIEPLIAVMIDPTEDRRSWYFFNADYLDYLERVVQHVDARYSTNSDPGRRLHVGSSSGGRATLYVGLERPDMFHNLAMFSPSLTGPPHYYEPLFAGARKPVTHLRVWLSAGTYEGYIYEDTRTIERVFKSAGLNTQATFTHEGHSLGTWRHLVKDMLLYFFPGK